MNDKFTDKTERDDDVIGQKLNRVSQQTQVNGQFTAELEERLRSAHRPKSNWFMLFEQVSPTLRWVALMVLLALVLSWSIKSLIPVPQPAVDSTPVNTGLPTPTPDVVPDESSTPVTGEDGYSFRGGRLFIQQPLPESPDTAYVYLMNREDRPATQEQARALADRFGIRGDVYRGGGLVFGTDDFLISDGKQSLQVHSETYFSYTSDMARSRRAYPAPTNPDAEAIIREFLNARGFDFPFRVYASLSTNGYVVQPLAPDTIPMQYESFSQPIMRVVLDENGQVLTIDASLMDYEQTPIGEYGIITAEQALQRLLADTLLTGKTELVHSAGSMPREWYRTYPDNEPVTLYGYISFTPAVDPGKPALITLDGVSLTGNTAGMDMLGESTFIKVIGQFRVENGIRKLSVDSWDRRINEVWASGVIRREEDQVVLVTDDSSGMQYPLVDPPADLPIDSQTPENTIGIGGVIENDMVSWFYIQFFEGNSGGGGGGGGGGLGFHQLNLSGTPVPFPDLTPQSETNGARQPTGTYGIQEGDTLFALAEKFGTTVEALQQLNGMTDANIFVGQNLVVPVPEAVEQKVEDLRGYLSITIHNKSDGTSTREYGLEVAQENGTSLYTLEGSLLSELDAYNALPVLITGTINTQGKLIVDGYKIPYPGLQFQILKGTQREEQLEGQTVIIFTTEEGNSYVEFLATNTFPAGNFTGYLGDLIQQEVLIIPDETFGGMPVAHVYQTAIVQENGSEMQVVANGIQVYTDGNVPGISDEFAPAHLTIDTVELVYFGSNPYYQMNDPNYEQRSPYMEPAWHFQGRYDNGTEFDVLIQALKQEFLLPELAPGSLPG